MLDKSPTSNMAFVLTMIFECAEFSKAGKKWVHRDFACQLYSYIPSSIHLPSEVCGTSLGESKSEASST